MDRRRPAGRGHMGPASAPARFTTSLRDGDWQAQWLRPAGDSQQPDRVTYLRTEVTPPAGAIDRVTAYVSAAHTYRLFVDGSPVDAWPSFSYPDEQYVRAVDLTGVVAGGRRSAVGVLHRWYGPGQGRPTSSPACCSSCRPGTATAAEWSSGRTARGSERPAEWLPSPQRNSDVGDFVEWVDGRDQPQGWSDAGYDDGAWSPVTVVGPAGTAPLPDLRAADHDRRDTGPPGPPAHRGRWCRRGGLRRRLRGTAARGVQPGAVRAHRRPASRLSARSRRPGLDAARDAGDESVVLLHHAGGQPGLRGLDLLRVPLPADRRPGGTRRRPGRGPHPARRHAGRPRRDVLLGQPHAQRGLALDDALVPLLQQRAIRRHADPGEGPVRLGRRQRVRGRHARLWRPEHELAGSARRGPRPGSLLAQRAVNAVYPNGDGARDYATFTARSQSGSGGTTPRRATGPRRCACTRRWRRWPTGSGGRARRAPDCSTAWATPATGTPSTATTSPWPPTPPATC